MAGKEEYILKECIGKGTFGEVYKTTKGTQIYALKKINLSLLEKKDREYAYSEVQFLKQLHHENLVVYCDSYEDDTCLCIVMEYCRGGTLKHEIEKHDKPFLEGECLNYSLQICKGVDYLHDQNIIHRDLKPRNIFLTQDNVIKIGDLGVARILESPNYYLLSKKVGTPYYMSPEMIDGKDYDQKTDIWSFGCCIFEMATLKEAFDAENIHELRDAICSNRQPAELRHIPYCMDFKNAIAHMLQNDSVQRPTSKQLLDFFKRHECENTKVPENSPSTSRPFHKLSSANLSKTFPGVLANDGDDVRPKQPMFKKTSKRNRYVSETDSSTRGSGMYDSNSSGYTSGTDCSRGSITSVTSQTSTLQSKIDDLEVQLKNLKTKLSREVGKSVDFALEAVHEQDENAYVRRLKDSGMFGERQLLLNKADLLSLRACTHSLQELYAMQKT